MRSPFWDNGFATDVEAATWGDGTTGVVGPVTTANSLYGTTSDDSVSNGRVSAVSNGNYVVTSADWNDGLTMNAGAATFGLGASGARNPVTSSNSVIGTPPGQVRRPSARLTSDDTVVVPTTQNRVLLMLLDLAPYFASPPPDVAATPEPGTSATTVTYTDPVADDLRDQSPPSISCTPASGSSFAVGDTTVTVPITPARFLDTRAAGDTIDNRDVGSGTVAGGSEITLAVAGRGDVPPDAAAVIVNVTAVQGTDIGFITAYACLSSPPNTASLNYVPDVNRSNELIVEIDTAGNLCLFTSADTHLTVDVTGYLPADTDLISIPPSRFADTRNSGQTVDGNAQGTGKQSADTETRLQIVGRPRIPTDADAVVMNVTAIQPERVGFITIHPCRTNRPNTASLNYLPRVNGGNEIVAILDDEGGICLYTSATTHFTADITAFHL